MEATIYIDHENIGKLEDVADVFNVEILSIERGVSTSGGYHKNSFVMLSFDDPSTLWEMGRAFESIKSKRNPVVSTAIGVIGDVSLGMRAVVANPELSFNERFKEAINKAIKDTPFIETPPERLSNLLNEIEVNAITFPSHNENFAKKTKNSFSKNFIKKLKDANSRK